MNRALPSLLKTAVMVLFALVMVAGVWGECYAQYFTERNDETYLILALKKAKARYDAAKAKYEAAEALMDRELMSPQDFEVAKSTFVNEEIKERRSRKVRQVIEHSVALRRAEGLTDGEVMQGGERSPGIAPDSGLLAGGQRGVLEVLAAEIARQHRERARVVHAE